MYPGTWAASTPDKAAVIVAETGEPRHATANSSRTRRVWRATSTTRVCDPATRSH